MKSVPKKKIKRLLDIANGKVTRKIYKPKLLELAKKHGGVTRLAELLGVSQGRVSQLIYTDATVSDSIAEQVFELTEGKLNLFQKAKSKTPKKLVTKTKVKSNEKPKARETKKPVKELKAKTTRPKVQKPAKKGLSAQEQSEYDTIHSEIFGDYTCVRTGKKDKPARSKVQKSTE